jgi:hypothetical protein
MASISTRSRDFPPNSTRFAVPSAITVRYQSTPGPYELTPQLDHLRPVYAARVSDLRLGDFVIVECACGHSGLIHPAGLTSLGLGPDDRIVDLAPRLRCRECDEKGKAAAAVKWA